MLVLSVLGFLCVAGCGGGGGNGGGGGGSTSTITSVSVSCSPASITTVQTSSCSASVAGTGSYSSGVTWTATDGAITSAGVFTPSAIGTATITATSTQDATKSGLATVTVNSVTTATLTWETSQIAGTSGSSGGNGVSLLGGNVLVSGTANGVNTTGTASNMILSYKSGDGTFNAPSYVSSPASILSVGLWGITNTSDGNYALVAGVDPITSAGTTIGSDSGANLKFQNFCYGSAGQGMFVAVAMVGTGSYLGIDRNPNAGPAVVKADADGKPDCSNNPPINLPINTIGTMGFIATTGRIGNITSDGSSLFVSGDANVNGGSVSGWLLKTDLNGIVQKSLALANVSLPKTVIVNEGGTNYVYVIATIWTATVTSYGTGKQWFYIDKYDMNLNRASGTWPQQWDGTIGTTAGGTVNYGNAMVANPGAAGGVVVVGQMTKLNLPVNNPDPNDGDCGIAAFGPTGTPLWQTRQGWSTADACNAAFTDPTTFSLYVAGITTPATTSVPQVMAAKFALPR